MEDPYMARTTRPLTHTEVQKAKPVDKDLSLYDRDGLFLLVKSSDIKLWRSCYKQPGIDERTMIALGSYPAFSLAEARQMRDEKLGLLARGIAPQKKQEQHEEEKLIAEDSIFLNVALNGLLSKNGKSPKGRLGKFGARLKKIFFPTLAIR